MSEMAATGYAEAIFEWARLVETGLGRPGSLIVVGSEWPPAFVELLARGWRGLEISTTGAPPPEGAGVIIAALVRDNSKLVMDGGVGFGTLHPSDLFELAQSLPEPRAVAISRGADTLPLFLLWRDWVAVTLAVLLDQGAVAELRAQAGLEGWRATYADAERCTLEPLEPPMLVAPVQPPGGAHPPSSSIPL